MLNSKLLDKPHALQDKLQSSINLFQLSTKGKSQKNHLVHPLVLNAIERY